MSEKPRQLEHISDEKLESRLNLPEEQWLTRPEGMSIGEWHQMRKKEREKGREKLKEST